MTALAFAASMVLALPAAYLTLICGYLLLLTLGAWCYRPREAAPAPPLRIAALIPAHNEEHQIGAILADLKAQRYSADLAASFVLADNCTDATAAMARTAGANVLERNNPDLRGKGYALDWALREHRDTLTPFDVITIVDADMNVDPNYFEAIAAAMGANGVEVVQALNTVSNPASHWRSALGYAGFSVINHLRPAGRCWLGGTADLKGSGMAFRGPVLLRYGWPAHSLAEDAEFGKRLLLDGIRVHYQPRARVTSGIPLLTAQAGVQQERWDRGKAHLFRQYAPVLLRRMAAQPSRLHLDALFDLFVPPLSALVGLTLAALALAILAGAAWIGLFAACFAAIAACIASALWLTRAPRAVWLYLGAVPLYLLWKLPLLVRVVMRRGAAAWQRTPRDHEVAPSQRK